MPRDLIKDLELISKATPPPWNGEENTGVEPVFETGCGCCTESTLSKEDAEFIAEAREGWPHAIERAIKAEAEAERYKLMVKSITGGLDEAIEIGDYLEAENALLRKVEEVGEIMWSEAVCHKCVARECRGCAAHDFKKALSEYQSWKEGQELDKEGER